jgi:hypothetical protein
VIAERLIVSPGVGVFEPGDFAEGADVTPGDVVGRIVGPGVQQLVHSPFAGRLMGMLAHAGERLRAGQPVAWLRAESGHA